MRKKRGHNKNTQAMEWRVDYTDAVKEEKDQLVKRLLLPKPQYDSSFFLKKK